MGDIEKRSSREERREKIKENIRNLNSEDLIYIPARQQLPVTEDTPKKRVAAYCRVSTDDPAQTTSYELQKEHYEEEINKNPDWVFAGIYADEGISATSMKHRDNFNRMITDCEAGKIDIIITKAVSRFARNVVDCLSMVRHLSALKHPVAVKFETEGINTLDSTSEMILAVMAAAAQEESKTKSNSMNWSLEKRFEKGKFLTPVLLGFDHDEEGKLIINEDEAQTVKLIFYLYLSGFPISEIADILGQLGRKTKLGNTHWSRSSIREIMENERHCGSVLSWKTYTYDFWEHRSRKNNQDKPQVLKKDHHEAIVSQEIFNATQLKLASEKYSRKGMPLPALEVIDEGVLKGYVPVNRLWTGFSEEDYREACESVYAGGDDADEMPTEDTDSMCCGDPYKGISAGSSLLKPGNQSEIFRIDGYRIVRSRFFSNPRQPRMTISQGKIKFNTYCLRKFEDVEYVEILLNSVEQCIAVRPCSEDNPNAVKWGRLKESKWIVSPKSCVGLEGPLYSIMSWSADCGYKLYGQYLCSGDEQMLIFDLADPEVMKFVEIDDEEDRFQDCKNAITAANIETDKDASKTANSNIDKAANKTAGKAADNIDGDKKIRLRTILVTPDFWDGTRTTDNLRTAIYFRTEQYEGDWQIMKPASVFRMSGNVSEETMRHVKEDANRLLNELRQQAV